MKKHQENEPTQESVLALNTVTEVTNKPMRSHHLLRLLADISGRTVFGALTADTDLSCTSRISA